MSNEILLSHGMPIINAALYCQLTSKLWKYSKDGDMSYSQS